MIVDGQAAVLRTRVERNAAQSQGGRYVVVVVVLQVRVVAVVEAKAELVDQRSREGVGLAEHEVLAQVALVVTLKASGSVEDWAQGRREGVDDVLVVDAESGQVAAADVPVEALIPIDRDSTPTVRFIW